MARCSRNWTRVAKVQQAAADAAKKAEAVQAALAAAYDESKEAMEGMDGRYGAIIAMLQEMGATPEMIAPLQKPSMACRKPSIQTKPAARTQSRGRGAECRHQNSSGDVVRTGQRSATNWWLHSRQLIAPPHRLARRSSGRWNYRGPVGHSMPLIGTPRCIWQVGAELRAKFSRAAPRRVATMEFIKSRVAGQDRCRTVHRIASLSEFRRRIWPSGRCRMPPTWRH